MSKIDCSNIFNFVNEWNRRRESEPHNLWISIGEAAYEEGLFGVNNLKKELEDLQKWSDEHPKQTRKEKFIQMCKDNDFELPLIDEDSSCKYPYCVYSTCHEDDCEKCKKYWDAEVD